jgi:hypothetical protein
MTRWSPDTCSCVIDYDDNVNITAVVTKCAKHAGTPDDATHFETVLAHNRKKNQVHGALVEHLKSLGIDAVAGVFVSYDDNDDLQIAGSGLPAAEQPKLLAKLSGVLGKTALKLRG